MIYFTFYPPPLIKICLKTKNIFMRKITILSKKRIKGFCKNCCFLAIARFCKAKSWQSCFVVIASKCTSICVAIPLNSSCAFSKSLRNSYEIATRILADSYPMTRETVLVLARNDKFSVILMATKISNDKLDFASL